MICEQQCGFMPRKRATDPVLALTTLMEKVRKNCIVLLWIQRKPRSGRETCQTGAGYVREQYDRGEMHWSRSDAWLQGAGRTASTIGPESFLVCYGDGQTDG